MGPARPVLIDQFLWRKPPKWDVDAPRRRVPNVVIGGIMEHNRRAGVHSGRFFLRAAARQPFTEPF